MRKQGNKKARPRSAHNNTYTKSGIKLVLKAPSSEQESHSGSVQYTTVQHSSTVFVCYLMSLGVCV